MLSDLFLHEWQREKPALQTEINGKLVEYDFCSEDEDVHPDLEHLNLQYLGASNTYFVDGIKNISKTILHYWKKI